MSSCDYKEEDELVETKMDTTFFDELLILTLWC